MLDTNVITATAASRYRTFGRELSMYHLKRAIVLIFVLPRTTFVQLHFGAIRTVSIVRDLENEKCIVCPSEYSNWPHVVIPGDAEHLANGQRS